MEAGPFDLISIDIVMPIMNGFEASQQIREREQVLQLKKLSSNRLQPG